MMAKPFEEALFAMQPGEVRGPVKTEFGWHVIKLEEIAEEKSRSFEEVRAELEPEMRRAEVEKAFGDRQEELDTLAFEAAGDLESVATKMGLPVHRVAGFTRAGGGELGSNPALIEAVFAADTLAGRELRTVERAPGRVVALGVTAHQPAVARPLEEIRPLIVNAARLEQAHRLGRTTRNCRARAQFLRRQGRSGAARCLGCARRRRHAPGAPRCPRAKGIASASVGSVRHLQHRAFREPGGQG